MHHHVMRYLYFLFPLPFSFFMLVCVHFYLLVFLWVKSSQRETSIASFSNVFEKSSKTSVVTALGFSKSRIRIGVQHFAWHGQTNITELYLFIFHLLWQICLPPNNKPLPPLVVHIVHTRTYARTCTHANTHSLFTMGLHCCAYQLISLQTT